MRPGRRRGLTRSGILHGVLLLLVVFGLPALFDRSRIEEPSAITVEILPVTGITNVRPSEPKPAPKPKPAPAKPQPPVKVEKETVKPQPKTVAAPPSPPKPEPEPKKPDPQPEKPEPKKPAEKPEEKTPPRPAPSEDDLLAVLKSVKETAQQAEASSSRSDAEEATEPEAPKALSNQFNPELALSMSEKDAIRSQIAKCWNVPAGAKDAQDLVVVLRVQLTQDGSVVNVVLGQESRARYNADSFFRAAADSAVRAVRQCSPLQHLPPGKYESWHDMELTFDPKEMLF